MTKKKGTMPLGHGSWTHNLDITIRLHQINNYEFVLKILN